MYPILPPDPASQGLVAYVNTFVLYPLNPKEVKKGEFQIVGRVAEKKKRY